MNQLIKYAADKRRIIFAHNISIIGSLLEKWRPVVNELNEDMLSKMLNSREGKIQNSDLWKMSALQIIALSSKLNIQCNLLNSIISQLDHRKRSIIYAASEVIGVVLSHQPELLEDTSSKIQSMFSGEAKQDLFVNIAQKISKYQGMFAVQKPILQKLLHFIKPFSASFRACILQSFTSAIKECLVQNNIKLIQEICMCLLSNNEDILADKDDECQQSFILLLKELVKVNDKSRDSLFTAIMNYDSGMNIHLIMTNNRNHLTRGLY